MTASGHSGFAPLSPDTEGIHWAETMEVFSRADFSMTTDSFVEIKSCVYNREC